jgi:hypothetical protein
MHRRIFYCVGVAVLSLGATANATTFTFNQDPFAGTNVLNVPGRQIIGGENFISFTPSLDVFSLDSTVFGTGSTVSFVNSSAAGSPASGANVIVLENFDDDNNPLTPFGAGNAANLIANQITTPGAGFFIYFNQSLDLPRLVYSTDLSSTDADLKILARMLNLNGANGRNALANFTAANFQFTSDAAQAPEPSSLSMILGVALIGAGCLQLRKHNSRNREESSTKPE